MVLRQALCERVNTPALHVVLLAGREVWHDMHDAHSKFNACCKAQQRALNYTRMM